jgi:hypothetical protein
MDLYSEILLKDLKRVKEDIKPTFDAYFLQKEPQIRYLIYTRWLLGKRPDGRRIGVYFSEEYREYKYFKNPLAGADVDLIDTGDLWKNIEIFNESDGIEIISTDEKFEKIIDKYGADNFNITDAQEEEIINEIQIKTIEYLYNKFVL